MHFWPGGGGERARGREGAREEGREKRRETETAMRSPKLYNSEWRMSENQWPGTVPNCGASTYTSVASSAAISAVATSVTAAPLRYFSFAPASAPSPSFASFSAFSAFSASFDAFQSRTAAVAVANVASTPADIDTMHTHTPGPIKRAAIVRGKAVLGLLVFWSWCFA